MPAMAGEGIYGEEEGRKEVFNQTTGSQEGD
jgi:hypothetical protein